MNSGQKQNGASKDKRDRILQAAWSLIRHYGFAKTTISDIAREAGVGKGTVYLYFESKADIMLGLVDLTNDRIVASVQRIVEGDGTPTERLRAALLHRIMTLYDMVQRYPHGEDVIATMLPDILKQVDRYLQRHAEQLAALVTEGVSSGELVSDDPAHTGRLLAGVFELLTPPHYRFPSRKALEAFAEQLLELILQGLARRAAGAA